LDTQLCETCGNAMEQVVATEDQLHVDWRCSQCNPVTQNDLRVNDLANHAFAAPAPVLLVSVSKANCWFCKEIGTVWRLPQCRDGIYGHFCRECGHSLRDHKYFGAGNPGDKALSLSVPQNRYSCEIDTLT
jgi:hypothetical protein